MYTNCIVKLYIPVKIVEEWEEVEGKFAPSLLLTVCQNICVHYSSGVIQSRSTHHRAAHIPAHKNNSWVALWARTMLTNHLLTSLTHMHDIKPINMKCAIHLGLRASPTSRRDRPAEACWVQASAILQHTGTLRRRTHGWGTLARRAEEAK